MAKYVAGFLLNRDSDTVALIEKLKGPSAVVGKLNAIGGKIEFSDSSSHVAMAREFQEETGVVIPSNDWHHFLTLTHENSWSVEFFVAKSDLVFKVKSIEEEQVNLFNVSNIYRLPVVPNVRWILPMALSLDIGEQVRRFTVLEHHK